MLFFSHRRFPLLAGLLVLLLACSGFYLNAQRGLFADDDNLWLFFASQKLATPETATGIEEKAIEYARSHGASPASMVRLDQRQDYIYNYVLPVTLWNPLTTLLAPHATLSGYPEFIATSLIGMFASTTLAAWLILLALLLRLNRPRLWASTLTGLSVIAALMLLPNSPPMMTLLSFDSLLRGLYNFAGFVLNPWPGFSVYSFTPRNNLSVLLIGVFALRWCGMNRAAYAAMIPLYGVHASLSLLVTVHMLALDLLRQRDKLRDAPTLALILVGVSYGLWRETLWENVGSHLGVIISLTSLMGLLAFLIWASRPLFGAEQLARRPYDLIESARPPLAESLWMIAFWVISTPPNWIICQFMSESQNQYFWHQLQGRAIGALGPVVIIGLVGYLPARWMQRLCLASLLIWGAGFAYNALAHPSPLAIIKSQAIEHEKFLAGEITPDNYKFNSGPGFVFSEPVLYYALGQMMVLQNDRWADLTRTASPQPFAEGSK